MEQGVNRLYISIQIRYAELWPKSTDKQDFFYNTIGIYKNKIKKWTNKIKI